MVGADEFGVMAAALDELGAAVQAGVPEPPDLAVVASHDDHRFVVDLIFEIIARVREFLHPACYLPDIGP
jgi:hypothetical protein